MNLLERARRAQADRDGRDAATDDEADQRERAALADWATVILDLVDRGRGLVAQHGDVRAALHATHPDKGGDPDDFAAVQAYRALDA